MYLTFIGELEGGVVGGHVYLTFIGELEGGGGCRRACVLDLHR